LITANIQRNPNWLIIKTLSSLHDSGLKEIRATTTSFYIPS
jgi:hypothetical protein